MGRKFNFVIIATLLILAALNALAQAQPQRPEGRRGGPSSVGAGLGGHRPISTGPGARPGGHAPINTARERWLSLPPADRQIFRRNAERWMQMSPEERQIMRQRENIRREQIRRETEQALRNSGLLLDQQKRDLFESRYMQERRKMEQTLRQQIETERQQQLPALIQQLKKEFQLEQPNSGATGKPAASPKSDH